MKPPRLHGRNRITSLLDPPPQTYDERLDLAADWQAFAALMIHECHCSSPLLRLALRKADQIMDQCKGV